MNYFKLVFKCTINTISGLYLLWTWNPWYYRILTAPFFIIILAAHLITLPVRVLIHRALLTQLLSD